MSHALSPARWICPPPAITGINTYYEYRASLSLTEGRAGAVLLLACGAMTKLFAARPLVTFTNKISNLYLSDLGLSIPQNVLIPRLGYV